MKLKPREDGQLALEVLDPEEARSDFEKFAQLFVWRVGGKLGPVLKPTVCNTEMAKALLATEEAHRLLPPVTGLINCPIIYEKEGQLGIAQPGYDPQTKMLVTGGKEPPKVELHTAVKELLELLAEFQFQSEGDKARAVAGLIAPALKLGGFITGRVPADVAEADQSQSGKTYRQRVVAAIYNERVSLVTNREGGVGSVDESLSAQLVAGPPFIQFDNFRGRLNSQHLEALLTAEGSFPCRIPHRGEIMVRPENFFVFLTSNGVDTTRDFANRSSIIRIRKKPAGFQYRKYEEGELLDHVRANQAFYLGCVFAVIRAWHEAAKPRTEETRHDFREWVQILDWIVQNIFKMKPLMDGHQQAQERVSNPDLVFLRAVAVAVEQMEELGKTQSATEIHHLCEAAGIPIPGLKELVDADRAARVIGSGMGRLFRQTETLEVDGYHIERQVDKKPRPDGNGHYETKTYIFSRGSAKNVKEATDKNVPNNDEPPLPATKQHAAPAYPTVTRGAGATRMSFVRLTESPQKVAVGSEQTPAQNGKP